MVSAITSATGYSDMNFSVSAGSNALTLTYDASDGDVALANVGYLDTVESVSASDANLSIDGVSVTRTSNTITDLIDGVTLTLNSTTSSAEIISGNWDSSNALLALQVFVDQMNSSISNLKALTDRGSSTSDPGALAGDPLASYLLKQLTSLTTQAIEGYADESIYLTNFGVLTELDGTLSIDEDKLRVTFLKIQHTLRQLRLAELYQTLHYFQDQCLARIIHRENIRLQSIAVQAPVQ